MFILPNGGCMNFIRCLGFLGLILMTVNGSQAAVFTIFNKGPQAIFVNPMWSGRCGCYELLQPGQSREYNSVFAGVNKIKWVQKFPGSNMMSDPNAMMIKSFEADINLGALNLGGKFEILNDGSYSSLFGVDGSGNGTARTTDGI